MKKEDIFTHSCAAILSLIAAPIIFNGISSSFSKILPERKIDVSFKIEDDENEEEDEDDFDYDVFDD